MSEFIYLVGWTIARQSFRKGAKLNYIYYCESNPVVGGIGGGVSLITSKVSSAKTYKHSPAAQQALNMVGMVRKNARVFKYTKKEYFEISLKGE